MDYITAVMLYLKNRVCKWDVLDKIWAKQYEKDYVIHPEEAENPWKRFVSDYKAQAARMLI